MRIEIDSNAPAVALAMRRLSGNFMPAIALNMRLAVAEVERTLKANVSGPIIKRRTGKLMNSIRSKITVDATGVTGEVGVVKIPYAHILEKGGIIFGHPWLYIPTNYWTKGGRFRKKETSGKRYMPLLAEKTAREMPSVIRKRFVIIPPFGYLQKTMEQTQGVLPNILQQGLLDAE